MKLKKLLALAMVGTMTLGMMACGSKDSTNDVANTESNTSTETNANTEANTSTESNTSTSTVKVQDVTLTMWGGEEDQTMLREMADAFIALHKDEVNLTVEIGVESEQSVKDTVLGDVEGAADVYSFANDQINELVAAGALMAIPDEMGRSDVEARNVAGSVAASTVDGKLYAYPRTADNGYFLFYNKEFLSEEDVASWEKMLEVAATAGKKVTMEMNSGWYTYGFFKAVGLDCSLAENGKDTIMNWNSTTNAVTGVQVAEKMLDICTSNGFIATEDAEFVTGIKDGSIIAGVNGTWNASNAQEAWGDNYAATKLPTFAINGTDYQMYSVAGYKMIGVNPHCENAGWALKLADYITNEENQVKSFEVRGNGPSNMNAASSAAVQENPAIAAFSKQQQWAAVQTVGANYWSATESFGQTLQDGNPNGIDLQTLLDDMVTAATAPVAE